MTYPGTHHQNWRPKVTALHCAVVMLVFVDDDDHDDNKDNNDNDNKWDFELNKLQLYSTFYCVNTNSAGVHYN
jgi:hypothetical protein